MIIFQDIKQTLEHRQFKYEAFENVHIGLDRGKLEVQV